MNKFLLISNVKINILYQSYKIKLIIFIKIKNITQGCLDFFVRFFQMGFFIDFFGFLK